MVGGFRHEFYVPVHIRIILHIDFHIFHRGRYTTNQIIMVIQQDLKWLNNNNWCYITGLFKKKTHSAIGLPPWIGNPHLVRIVGFKAQDTNYWLVVWNMICFFHSVGNFIIPTDFHIFQRD